MKKGILIAALLLCCGLVNAKTNDEVRETLDETFTGSLSEEDTKQRLVRAYYIGDIRFFETGLPLTSVNAPALSDYIKAMVAPNSWDKTNIAVCNDDKLVINQTEENHLLITKLLQDIRFKKNALFRVSFSKRGLPDDKKEVLETKTSLCGQEITFALPERQGTQSLEISPCLTAVPDEQAQQNKPFQVQLPPGKPVKVKGIAGKHNGYDVLKLTLTVEGKEPETRLFYGSLVPKKEYILRAYETAGCIKNDSMGRLIDTIKDTIEPDSWKDEAVTIKADGTRVLVVQTEKVHAKISDLLSELSKLSQSPKSKEIR